MREQRIMATVAHPLRRKILFALESQASAEQLAEECDTELNRINYHLSVLARWGVLFGFDRNKPNVILHLQLGEHSKLLLHAARKAEEVQSQQGSLALMPPSNDSEGLFVAVTDWKRLKNHVAKASRPRITWRIMSWWFISFGVHA